MMAKVSPQVPAFAGAVLLGLVGLTVLFGLGFLALVGFIGGVLLLIVRLVTHRGPSVRVLLLVIAASLALGVIGVGSGSNSVSTANAQDEIVVTGAEWNVPGIGSGSISYSDPAPQCDQATAGGFWPACSQTFYAPMYQQLSDTNVATTASVFDWIVGGKCQHLDTGSHSYHHCRAREDSCSNLGCAAWHARLETVFVYNGRSSAHSSATYGTYVSCTVPSSTGFVVHIDFCGWRDVWHNPAPYGGGEHITAQLRYTVSFVFYGFPIQQSHAISWHLYGSGGAYPHPNDHI